MKINDLRAQIAADPSLADEHCDGHQDVDTYLWSGNTVARLIQHARRLGVNAYVDADTNLLVWRRTRIHLSGDAGAVLRWYDDVVLYR